MNEAVRMLRIALVKPISASLSLHLILISLSSSSPLSSSLSLSCALPKLVLTAWRVARVSGEHCSLFHSCLLPRLRQGHSPSITRLLTAVKKAKRLRSFPQICRDISASTCYGWGCPSTILSSTGMPFNS